MRSARHLLLIAILGSSFCITSLQAQQPPKPPKQKARVGQSPLEPQKFSFQGVEVEFTIAPLASNNAGPGDLMEAEDAILRFRIADAASKTPWAGAKPAVWLARRQGTATDPKLCREKINSYLQGTLRSRPDVDLNAYYLLTLNQEANISVIDPLLGFGGSKLITLIQLRSPGEDWVITKDQSRLFVSMPAVNQVAVVDTTNWKVVTNVSTGAKPVRLSLQSDEKYLWVGTEEGPESGVTVIDTTTSRVAARIPTGGGPHEVVLSDDNKFAYVTNRGAGTMTVINVQKLERSGEIKIGKSPAEAAFSPLSKAVYVSDEAGGEIVVVGGAKRRVIARIATQPGVNRIRFAPGGRFGFAANPTSDSVHIFDASNNRLLHTVPVGRTPDQIAFTKDFAYVRLAGAVEVVMIRLITIGKELDIVRFPGGQNSFSDSKVPAGFADAIVPTPEGNSVVVANTADRQLYYYTEGMAAPMGNFQNYRRTPRAVLIADRSLRETRTGFFEAVTRIPNAGVYDVAFLLDTPRIAHCFQAQAVVNPTIKKKRELALRIEYLNGNQPLRAGVDYKLRFRLFDTSTNTPKNGLTDVHVLTFRAPGVWQKRAYAKGTGDGIYELAIKVPEPGVYMIFIESKSQAVTFRDLPYHTLHGQPAAPPAVTAAPK
jgi:YVTN family beta-propeller protein